MEKGKRADIYLEVRKRRGIYFLNETSACVIDAHVLSFTSAMADAARDLFMAAIMVLR